MELTVGKIQSRTTVTSNMNLWLKLVQGGLQWLNSTQRESRSDECEKFNDQPITGRFQEFLMLKSGQLLMNYSDFEADFGRILVVDKNNVGDKGQECHQSLFFIIYEFIIQIKKVFIGSSLFHTRVALQRIKSQCLVFCKILLVLKHLIQIGQHLYHHKNNPRLEAMMEVDSSA